MGRSPQDDGNTERNPMPSKKLSKPLYQTLLNDIAAIYDGAMKEMGVAVDGILKKNLNKRSLP